jgi:hypothetical protein
MKTFQVKHGETLVDDEVYEALMQHPEWKWSAKGNMEYVNFGYGKVINGEKCTTRISLHRWILESFYGVSIGGCDVDHINRDKLDNRKENLRVVKRKENQCNKGIQINNTSGYKGVDWVKKAGKWRAKIRVGKRHQIHLGYFDAIEDAAAAYKEAQQKYHGEFANDYFLEN